MPFFGQEIFLKAQEKGPLTTPAYREALEKCRAPLARRGPRRGPGRSTGWTRSSRRPAARPGSSTSSTATTSWAATRRRRRSPATRASPCRWASSFGLPVGLSFIGRAWSEPVLDPPRLRLRAGDAAPPAARGSCAPPTAGLTPLAVRATATDALGAREPPEGVSGTGLGAACRSSEAGSCRPLLTSGDDDRPDDQALRDRGAARQGRHGRRLPRPRHPPRPPGRPQAAAAGVHARPRPQGPLPAGGAARGAVNHPAIAQIYDVDEGPEGLFIAMELVEGKTVKALIQGRELDVLGALEIADPGGGRAAEGARGRASSTATSSPRT